MDAELKQQPAAAAVEDPRTFVLLVSWQKRKNLDIIDIHLRIQGSLEISNFFTMFAYYIYGSIAVSPKFAKKRIMRISQYKTRCGQTYK